ncbi:hypothetical protein METHB2_270043 [Candidatus Methylobacter favarea]|uniref:Uncharacterized protein n=1 Tax=Candidatus Methylobacter favarea TaxID=2707345 RepID=A0A8S0Y684_9GAMM|nr:hypothetical protein [Candidatus Methylobacter favarea]CAA9890713.1 hypothetical protein METHB2_270043 [Candidatus Methylobacter favarea]
MADAHVKLNSYVQDWAAIAFSAKPDFSLADAELLPLLNLRNEQTTADWELIKKQEKAAVELQKQLTATQNLIDAARLRQESLAVEHTALDKKHAENTSNLEHARSIVPELEKQLNAIIDLVAAPFLGIENWQSYLHNAAEFKRE